MLIRVMICQSIQLVHWENCNNVEHSVTLGILSNTILSCVVVGDDKTRKMLDEDIVSRFFFLVSGNFRLNGVVPGVKL